MISLWVSGILLVGFLLTLGMALLFRWGSSTAKLVLALAVGNAGFFNGIAEGFSSLLWWQLWMNGLFVPYMIDVLKDRRLRKDR